MRKALSEAVDRMRESNEKKLEQMRMTVDEKLGLRNAQILTKAHLQGVVLCPHISEPSRFPQIFNLTWNYNLLCPIVCGRIYGVPFKSLDLRPWCTSVFSFG